SATNDSLANYCATRVFELTRLRGTGGTGGGGGGVNGTLTSRGNDNNPAAPNAPPIASGGGSNPARLRPRPAGPPANNLRSTGGGILRRAGFNIDNRPTYALLARNGVVAFYVTPEPGINLEPYVERPVDLHGYIEVRGDVRGADYMRVVRVYLLR